MTKKATKKVTKRKNKTVRKVPVPKVNTKHNRKTKPSKKTDEKGKYTEAQKNRILGKVAALLEKGLSVNRACLEIKVPVTTVNTWIDDDMDVSMKMERAKQQVHNLADEQMVKLLKGGNVEMVKMVKRAKDPEYGNRLTIDGNLDIDRINREWAERQLESMYGKDNEN